jgi:hypothetical protein
MSRIALALAAALLAANGFAAGQTGRSPTVRITLASPETENAEDKLPDADPSTEKSPANTSLPFPRPEGPGPSPAAIQPVMGPPSAGMAGPPQADGFSAFPLSPAGYRFWLGAETLLWWEKKEQLPANLVTTGLSTDAVPGALGQPNTLGLSGPGKFDYGPFTGMRLFAGAWLDPHQILGVDAGGFVLEDRGQGFAFHSTVGGNPLLALRRLDALTGAANAFVIAAPAASSGGIAVRTDSQLWGADANLLHTCYWSPSFRLVGLFGFRYLDLSEALSVQTRRMALDGSTVSFLGQRFAAPAFELTADRFHARSQFFGGQAGLRGEYYFSHFFVAAAGKLALGRTNEAMHALGISTLQIGSAPLLSTAGGLFALPSNSGHFVNQDFGIIPELQLKGGVLLTRWLRATIGYDILYWSRVLRAGDTLDLTVDNRQVPTSPSFQAGVVGHSPQPAFPTGSFWVQGLTFGLEFTY